MTKPSPSKLRKELKTFFDCLIASLTLFAVVVVWTIFGVALTGKFPFDLPSVPQNQPSLTQALLQAPAAISQGLLSMLSQFALPIVFAVSSAAILFYILSKIPFISTAITKVLELEERLERKKDTP